MFEITIISRTSCDALNGVFTGPERTEAGMINHNTMFRSYLTIALRNVRRYLGYSSINIFGLAVGLACCLLIFIYTRNEWAVNTVIADVEHIYRVDSQWRDPAMGIPMTTLAPVGQTLVREYPEVIDQVRLYLMSNTIRVGDDSFRKEVMMADTSLFRLTALPLLHGDPEDVLRRPRSVVITEQLAQSLFGVTNALGRTIQFETWSQGEQAFTVTGIRKTLPHNSVTYFNSEKDNYDIIISPYPYGDFFGEAGWTDWNSRYILQYVKLTPDHNAEVLQTKLASFVETFAPSSFHGNLSITLNPLRTLYLSDNDDLGWRVVQGLSAVAALLLFLAAINFMNLSTARSLSRAKEIGIRKALGAGKPQLLAQFLGESVLLCAISAALGVGLAGLSKDLLFQFAGKEQVLTQPLGCPYRLSCHRHRDRHRAWRGTLSRTRPFVVQTRKGAERITPGQLGSRTSASGAGYHAIYDRHRPSRRRGYHFQAGLLHHSERPRL